MGGMKRTATGVAPLPGPGQWPLELRRLFWDLDPASISPSAHRAFIVQRVLCAGGLGALNWLRSWVSDDELRRHLQTRQGREISPRRLRYFELILGLPNPEVTAWIRGQLAEPVPGRRRALQCTPGP